MARSQSGSYSGPDMDPSTQTERFQNGRDLLNFFLNWLRPLLAIKCRYERRQSPLESYGKETSFHRFQATKVLIRQTAKAASCLLLRWLTL